MFILELSGEAEALAGRLRAARDGPGECTAAPQPRAELEFPQTKSQALKSLRIIAQDFQSSSALLLTPGNELEKPHQCLGA